MTDNIQSALVELIKCSLFGISPDLPEQIDYSAVLEEAQAQTVTAVAAPAVPRPFSAQWEELASQSMAHYMRSLYEQTNLIKLFESNSIELVILKGAAAAIYYPQPKRRTMGDVDFLVYEKDFERAFSLLESNGYEALEDNQKGRDYAFIKGGVEFELHRRYSHEELDIEAVLVSAMERPVSRTVNGHTFPTLPDFENGLVLLEHIKHHISHGLGLRQIIDWTMFANRVLDNENYEDHFLPIIKPLGLETFCKIVTKMCKTHLFLPESVTWCDDADAATADQLFDVVMSSGNFGAKTPYVPRPVMKFTISVREKGLFRTLQDNGVDTFPICKRNKFFRAFAWLLQIFRYIVRLIIAPFRGEKVASEITAGNDKLDFYKRLGI